MTRRPIISGTGSDTIQGGAGIDIIDAGNGTNNIYGDEGNDYLTGGSGTNRFFGGSGNDFLQGGTGLNLLKGTDSNTTLIDEVDTLTGNPSARSNAFYIGDNRINWYSANGSNDYALIVNFNPNTDIILSGVNIEAQEIGIQTFLWSGSELIAKVEGLWASRLNYPIRTS
jgi:Ca2+-binding RTX toxin-like protein